MRIQLELNSEFANRLCAEAEARGVGLDERAEALLREAIGTRPQPRGNLSVEELRAMLNAIREGSDRLPKLSTSTFTRESLHEVHL
jgi:hypothetical protein